MIPLIPAALEHGSGLGKQLWKETPCSDPPKSLRAGCLLGVPLPAALRAGLVRIKGCLDAASGAP